MFCGVFLRPYVRVVANIQRVFALVEFVTRVAVSVGVVVVVTCHIAHFHGKA